jgi:hypothetical protein
MRIFSGVLAIGLLAAAGIAAAETAAVPQSPLQKGLDAYQAGQQDAAIPALSEAAATGEPSGRLYAEFYLARIYADSVGADHPKAYMLFRKIAEENIDVDPDRSPRAPFVAKSLIALAGYLRTGIKEIDLAPNPRRAADYLHHAATYFGDRDAQFELARIYLAREGGGDDIKRGLHYLAALTEASHPAAQAMLADLFWRGRHVKKDEGRALALATLAAANAPAHERIWIEENYAAIFCASGEATRSQADSIMTRWRMMFAPPAPDPSGPATRHALVPDRQCASGETVAIVRTGKADLARAAPPVATLAADPPAATAPASTVPATAAPVRAGPLKARASSSPVRAAGVVGGKK